MRFKIVSAGWRCADFWQRTVESIESQSVDNWDAAIAYDGGDDAGPKIKAWADEHGPRWHVSLPAVQQFAPRNQYEAIRSLDPADDDVVVFLDLDDYFAHPDVLAHLGEAYADGTLVTYGSYRPEPYDPWCPTAKPYPPEVIARNAYREWIRTGHECMFNHMRTMKGRVVNAIPEWRFKWPDGRWYEGPADYLMMVPALELAGPRHKCLSEIFVIYNSANPNADNKTHPGASTAGCFDMLSQPPMDMLP
jgi:glycosyltransferase involved in cell wall biosynthesis